jgi:hypothetical protein
MTGNDIFFKEQMVKEEVVLKGRSKRASSTSKKVKLTKKDAVILDKVQIPDEDLFGKVVFVDLGRSSDGGKVRYSVSQDVNRRFLFTLSILEELIPYTKSIGFTREDYRKNVLGPLQRLALGRVKHKRQKMKVEQNKDGGTVKLSSFQIPRKAKDEYDKLYRKLEKEGNDMSSISYDNGSVSLLDSAKTIRMYFSVHDLKDADTKHIVLDTFLKELFKDRIEELYTANKGEFVTQRQVQTLASWLVNKLK